eukprot:gene15823-63523_t
MPSVQQWTLAAGQFCVDGFTYSDAVANAKSHDDCKAECLASEPCVGVAVSKSDFADEPGCFLCTTKSLAGNANMITYWRPAVPATQAPTTATPCDSSVNHRKGRPYGDEHAFDCGAGASPVDGWAASALCAGGDAAECGSEQHRQSCFDACFALGQAGCCASRAEPGPDGCRFAAGMK